MSTTAIGATSAANTSTTSSSTSTSSSAITTTDFLSLLVEQLQNQDPLNPTDPTQLMQQMMSYASYGQQTLTNTKLDTLTTAVNSLSTGLGITV